MVKTLGGRPAGRIFVGIWVVMKINEYFGAHLIGVEVALGAGKLDGAPSDHACAID
jgi:hypothetical protein